MKHFDVTVVPRRCLSPISVFLCVPSTGSGQVSACSPCKRKGPFGLRRVCRTLSLLCVLPGSARVAARFAARRARRAFGSAGAGCGENRSVLFLRKLTPKSEKNRKKLQKSANPRLPILTLSPRPSHPPWHGYGSRLSHGRLALPGCRGRPDARARAGGLPKIAQKLPKNPALPAPKKTEPDQPRADPAPCPTANVLRSEPPNEGPAPMARARVPPSSAGRPRPPVPASQTVLPR